MSRYLAIYSEVLLATVWSESRVSAGDVEHSTSREFSSLPIDHRPPVDLLAGCQAPVCAFVGHFFSKVYL